MTYVLPVALGLLAAVVRLLASADMSNDHYMHMAWAQQLLFGELPGRDFVDPGMPLAYALSAVVQWIRPGPVSEMILSASMLGIAAGVTCHVARAVAGSWLVAVGVTMLEIALQPRFYSYPKILVPAVTLFLLVRYLEQRTTSRLAWLGAWTSIAILLRHDYAIYVCTGVGCSLLAIHWPSWRRLVDAGWRYVVAVTLTLLPYLAYVQWSEGLLEHLRRGIEFGRADEHQRRFALPAFGAFGDGWSRENAVAFLFYAAHALVPILLALMVARRRQPREWLAAAAGTTGMLVAYLAVILRFPVDQRLPDMAGILALGGAVAIGGLAALIHGQFRSRPRVSALGAVTTAVLLAATGSSVWVLGQTDEMIDKTGAYAGTRGLRETFVARRASDWEWPWTGGWPTGAFPPAIAYLDACTEPDAALLLNWRAPEYNFFARRRFAAGHAEFLAPRSYTSAADQAQMLTWLEGQFVPVVLINQELDEEFSRTYGMVDAYLKASYTPVGRFTIYDGAEIIVAVRNGLQHSRVWGPDEWPCAFASAAE